MKKYMIGGLLLVGLPGCTWVHLSDKAEAVEIGYAGNVQHCQMVGVVDVMTQSKLVMERDTAKVQQELYTLARNNAVSLGATNLLQRGLPENGAQAFSAYRCPQLG